MTSEEQPVTPPPAAPTQNQSHPDKLHGQGRRRRRRNRNRNRRRRRGQAHSQVAQHPPQQNKQRQRRRHRERDVTTESRHTHSTYDPLLHHRSKGQSGYGWRRDVAQDSEELKGSSLPPGILS